MENKKHPDNRHEDFDCCSAAPDQDHSNDPLYEWQEKLAACQMELAQWKEKLLYINADFQNFKKRQEKEQALWMQSAQTAVFRDLLDIVDDFDRALAATESAETTEEFQSSRAGFLMIRAALYKMLAKYGVSEITEVKVFDPELHESIVAVDSPNHASGEIVEVLQKGFRTKDQVLRPSRVAVAK
jgi:molecular chaperone GrpE